MAKNKFGIYRRDGGFSQLAFGGQFNLEGKGSKMFRRNTEQYSEDKYKLPGALLLLV